MTPCHGPGEHLLPTRPCPAPSFFLSLPLNTPGLTGVGGGRTLLPFPNASRLPPTASLSKLSDLVSPFPPEVGEEERHHSSQGVPVVKNLPARAENVRDVGSIPGSGRSPGGGYGNALQCSCL